MLSPSSSRRRFLSYEVILRGFSRYAPDMQQGTANFLAGGLASNFFWTGAFAFDSVKNRYMTDSLTQPRYTTWRSCARAIYAEGGPKVRPSPLSRRAQMTHADARHARAGVLPRLRAGHSASVPDRAFPLSLLLCSPSPRPDPRLALLAERIGIVCVGGRHAAHGRREDRREERLSEREAEEGGRGATTSSYFYRLRVGTCNTPFIEPAVRPCKLEREEAGPSRARRPRGTKSAVVLLASLSNLAQPGSTWLRTLV